MDIKNQKKISYREKENREKIISIVMNLIASEEQVSISLLHHKTNLPKTTCKFIFNLLEKRSLIKDIETAELIASQIITSYGINGFRATLILELANALTTVPSAIKEPSSSDALSSTKGILKKLSDYQKIILEIQDLEKQIIQNQETITKLQEKNKNCSIKINTLNKQLPHDFKVKNI